MAESRLNVNISTEFLPFLEAQNYEKSIDEKVNLSLAVFLFTERAVTLARAADLAGKSPAEFIQILTKHNISWSEFSQEHHKQDEASLQYILGEEKNA
jgi:predicted HTH domain antitoxin